MNIAPENSGLADAVAGSSRRARDQHELQRRPPRARSRATPRYSRRSGPAARPPARPCAPRSRRSPRRSGSSGRRSAASWRAPSRIHIGERQRRASVAPTPRAELGRHSAASSTASPRHQAERRPAGRHSDRNAAERDAPGLRQRARQPRRGRGQMRQRMLVGEIGHAQTIAHCRASGNGSPDHGFRLVLTATLETWLSRTRVMASH